MKSNRHLFILLTGILFLGSFLTASGFQAGDSASTPGSTMQTGEQTNTQGISLTNSNGSAAGNQPESQVPPDSPEANTSEVPAAASGSQEPGVSSQTVDGIGADSTPQSDQNLPSDDSTLKLTPIIITPSPSPSPFPTEIILPPPPPPTFMEKYGKYVYFGLSLLILAFIILILLLLRSNKNGRRKSRRKLQPSRTVIISPVEVKRRSPMPAQKFHTEVLDGQQNSIRYEFGACQGQGDRSYQEDAIWVSDTEDNLLVSKNGVCLVIADGMGGMENGRESAQTAVRVFSENYNRLDMNSCIPDELLAFARHANQLIYKRNEELNVVGGSTLICVSIHEDIIYWISIGDSLIFLLRDGILCQVNIEHELEARLIQEYIDDSESGNQVAETSSSDLRKLTSNLGRSTIKAIDQNIRPFTLLPGDRILLCSDGVSECLSRNEITKVLSGSETAQKCAAQIDHMIMKKNYSGQDNYSAIVTFCK